MSSTTDGRLRLAATIAFFISLLASAPAATAATINIAWDANAPAENVVGYKVYIGTQSGVYGSPVDVGNVTTYSFTSAIAGQTYFFAVAAYDVAGANSLLSGEVPGAAASTDTTVPGVTITSPTSASTFSTASSPISVSGTASDNVGVTQVTYTLNGGASTAASGTTSWSIASISLVSGTNTLVVTARDAAGNTNTDTLTITFTPDTTVPGVTITAPTSAATFSTAASTVALGGTASDNVGVTQVSYRVNGGASINAAGTTSWSVSSVALQMGSNSIVVTARDAAGNTATDTLTVTRTDGTAPAIGITTPTSASTYSTSSSTIAVSGTASDNVGVTQVTWTNSAGGSGTATGTTSWSVSSITLQPGSNVLSLTARDAAGNQSAATLTVTYTAPALQLTNITSNLASPQNTGSAITFTAAVSGGMSPYQTKWWLWDGTTWTLLRDWAAGVTFAWTPSVANPNYRMGAWVRNAGVTADDSSVNLSIPYVINAPASSAPLAVTSLTSNLTSPQTTGTGITFTATANGGTAPTQYKWWVYDGAVWTMARDWGTGNTYTWTPAQANSGYLIGVWARSAGNSADAGDNGNCYQSVSFTITSGGSSSSPLAVTGLTSNLASPQEVGTSIMFTATATGGTAPYQYKWWVFDGVNWVIGRDWAAGNTFTWVPSAASPDARIGVWVRSATNTLDAADNNNSFVSIAYPINATTSAPLAITALTPSAAAPRPAGSTITFTASSTGGVGPVQYKFWVFDGTTWTVVRGWSTTSTYTWTPTVPSANYIVGVWARSATNTADDGDNGNCYFSFSYPIQ